MPVPDLVIWASRVVTPGGVRPAAVSISGGLITAVEPGQHEATEERRAGEVMHGRARHLQYELVGGYE